MICFTNAFHGMTLGALFVTGNSMKRGGAGIPLVRRQQIGTPDEESLSWLAARRGIRQFTGPAGSAVFFDCNAMHGSNGNTTPYPRSNVFIVYNSIENTLIEPFGAPAPRPSFIASRTFHPV